MVVPQKLKVLIEELIKASSNEGDLVADFYGNGSFTTSLQRIKRNFIGCDINRKSLKLDVKD